jgi:hypothetical protein
MNNPYSAPGSGGYPGEPGGGSPSARGTFLLAAIGAWFAAAYWALMTGLYGLGAALGSGSVVNLLLPGVLIVLYILRGMQVLRGDAGAARRLLVLHCVGGAVALLNVAGASSFPLVMGLHCVKLLVHVFGGIGAEMARRAA